MAAAAADIDTAKLMDVDKGIWLRYQWFIELKKIIENAGPSTAAAAVENSAAPSLVAAAVDIDTGKPMDVDKGN